MRLTNRTLNKCATPRLFRTLSVNYDYTCRQNNSLERLARIADSPVSQFVKKLIVAPKNGVHRPDFEPLRTNLIHLACILPSAIKKLKNLQSLHVHGCAAILGWRHSLSFPEELRVLFTRILGHTLCLLTGSQTNNLTDLELHLPLAVDFSEIAHMHHVLLHNTELRRLAVQIQDNSGDGGHAHLHASQSVIQTLHPNRLHSRGLVDFVSLAPQITSLSISATHLLDLSDLAHVIFKNLRELVFERVEFCGAKLLAILSGEQRELLKHLELRDCALRCGAWRIVFAQLASLRGLKNLVIQNAVYNVNSKSKTRFTGETSATSVNGVPKLPASHARNMSQSDYEALLHLLHSVHKSPADSMLTV